MCIVYFLFFQKLLGRCNFSPLFLFEILFPPYFTCCMRVLPTCVVYHVCLVPVEAKRALDLLELELGEL